MTASAPSMAEIQSTFPWLPQIGEIVVTVPQGVGDLDCDYAGEVVGYVPDGYPDEHRIGQPIIAILLERRGGPFGGTVEPPGTKHVAHPRFLWPLWYAVQQLEDHCRGRSFAPTEAARARQLWPAYFAARGELAPGNDHPHQQEGA